MRLRVTLFIAPRLEGEVIRMEIYESEMVDSRQTPGYWVTKSNKIVLSPEAYGWFRSLESQEAQGKFCSKLTRVEQLRLE